MKAPITDTTLGIMRQVTKHGMQYFYRRGTKCPECGESQFFHVTNLLNEVSNPQKGIYELCCTNCHCEWQEVVSE